VRVTVLHTIGADHQYAVELNGAQGTLLGPASGAWKAFQGVLDGAAVVLAGEAIGGAERSLELAVEYSKQRVAFGRPIGSFQALQHKMSRAITEITGAQLAVYEAAFRLASGDASAQLDVSLAKAAANMAFSTASIEACHIYGGAGFVRGAEIELFYRRALGSEVTMGTPRWHKKRITKLMAAQSHAAAH
jgi:acyl-CoA dehydrogenase